MDFNFSVNAIFKDKLSKVGSNLLPNCYVPERRGDVEAVNKVSAVLDKMGIVSAKAQNLPSPITSALKLRNSDHTVYVVTDRDGNRGHGSIVGILKVGHKKLFIYDLNGIQWEMNPLCVLDFYVHESKQRTGFGKMLFNFMLQDQNVKPNHLALDQPSESFLSFMCKHYGLDSIIPQIYNFVVYDNFFNDRCDTYRCTSSASCSTSRSNLKPSQKDNKPLLKGVKATGNSQDTQPTYGRHSAKKAGSTMAEYMQDGSTATSNGSRQGSQSTNHDASFSKSSLASQILKHAESSNLHDGDGPSHPTGSAAAFRVSSAAEQVEPAPRTFSIGNYGKDTYDQNGLEANSPEEAVSKLDLKFHHTHLCQGLEADLNFDQYLPPSARRCSVGQLFQQDPNETNDEPFLNGDISSSHKNRKVSNIPIGDVSEEEDNFQPEMVEALLFKQNGNPYTYGSDGVKDVRIKKTNFANLSPFRRW